MPKLILASDNASGTMAQNPDIGQRKPPHPIGDLNNNVAALQLQIIQLELALNYRDSVNALVSQITPRPEERKAYLAHKRTLLGDDARQILTILWKESDFVSKSLQFAGVSKAFPSSDITTHGLAVALAERPWDVAALNSRVRSVTIAGSYFGLINRRILSPTKVYISGTVELHRFMLDLSLKDKESLKKLPT